MNISFKSRYETIDDLLTDGGANEFIIINDNKEIGFITLQSNGCGNEVYLESIDLKDKYQRRGYGTQILNQIKDMCRLFDIKYIEGECRYDLIEFYIKLGADFNHRTLEDETYMNHRFYIDL